jgi:hypothetical protein
MRNHNEERNEKEQNPSGAERCCRPSGRRRCSGPEDYALRVKGLPTPPKESPQARRDRDTPNDPSINLPLGLRGLLHRSDDTTPGIAVVTKPDSDAALVTDPGATPETPTARPPHRMAWTETDLHSPSTETALLPPEFRSDSP